MSEKRITIKADIKLKGVEITVKTTEDLTTEDEAQDFVNRHGLGAGDFDLNLADEEIEVFDVYDADPIKEET